MRHNYTHDIFIYNYTCISGKENYTDYKLSEYKVQLQLFCFPIIIYNNWITEQLLAFHTLRSQQLSN